MKKILVPVDFSSNAHNAYLYARELAAEIGAEIKLIHIHRSGFTDKAFLEKPVLRDELRALEKQLATFKSRFPDEDPVVTTIKTDTEVITAPVIVDKIAELSVSFDLIIMGTQGEHSLIEKLLGSVSSGVAQLATCPVLLIPKGIHFGPFQKIIFAGNWESSASSAMDAITSWVRPFGAHLDFVHVSPDYEFKTFEKVKEELLRRLRESGNADIRFSFTNIEENSPLSGILRYAEQQEADLIILVNRQRGIFQNLLGLSLTKELAMLTSLPLLILHYEADGEKWRNEV